MAAPGHTQLTVLGEGGFGTVVLARHDASRRVVAIKYPRSTDEAASGAGTRPRSCTAW